MAIQDGIFPLKGSIGNVTFVRGRNGVYRAHRKSSIDKQRLSTDSAFERTRENNAEFSRASKSGTLLRQAFNTQINQLKTASLVPRLLTEMLKVVKLDSVNPRGLRKVLDAETEMLEGFQFSISTSLATAFKVAHVATIDRVTGVVGVNIPAFIPSADIKAPDGATHLKIVAAGAAIGFEDEVFTTAESVSPMIPWNATPTAPLVLSVNLPANSTHPLFLLLGLYFYQEVNGAMVPLKNGQHNALGIIKVSGV